MCTGLDKRQVMFAFLREYQWLTILTRFINQVAIWIYIQHPIKHLRWWIHLCYHMKVYLTFYKCFSVSFNWVEASLLCNIKMNVVFSLLVLLSLQRDGEERSKYRCVFRSLWGKVYFNIVSNNNGRTQNCDFSVLDRKYPFWPSFIQKSKLPV